MAGQRYPASIVAVDREHDLALLKIDARDLEPLPLGESQQVQLAQELRVVGFPLSDVLGESIKVSRGTVAGFVEQDEGRMLQIDAGINPGNSGGPLVDDRGRVIGVASAKLSGEAISNVGFAVPVDAVKRLLDANGVPSSKMESPAQSLKGPELARRVTPGVALLYVTTGPGGFDIDPRWSFRFSGSITTRTDDRMRYRPGQLGFRIPTMPRGPQLSYPKLDRGTVALDVYGRSVEADGEESLPFLLGSLGSMIFEPLGRPGQTRWQSHRTVSIHHIRKPERSGPPGFPRPPRMRIPSPFGPRFPFDDEPEEEDDVVAIQSAIEHVDYELTGNTDHEAVIRKRYRLKTVDNKDLSEDVPELNLTGEGEIRFDKLAGAPLSQEFNATLTIDEGDTTVRLPLTFSYRYFSSDDLAAAKKASSQAEQDTGTQVGSENSHEPTVPSEVPAKEPVEAPKDIADVLDAIEGSDLQRRRTALAALGDMEPDQHQDRVVGRLNDLLASEDSFTRITAARAMRRWANATALPALIEALDDDNLAVRHNAVEALAGLRAPEGASAIVERWRKLPGVGRSALQKMGIAAEPAVLQLLGSGDWSLRVDACRVLEAVGTQACIAALEQARQDEHRSVGSAAERALDRVQQRLAGKDQE